MPPLHAAINSSSKTQSSATGSTFNEAHFATQVESFCTSSLETFKQITRQYALFHVAFFTLGLCELLAFILFFSTLTRSALFAFTIAGLLFTGFAYFVLLFYLQAKKPQQLQTLRSQFVQQCAELLPFTETDCAHHLTLSRALYHLLARLHGQEYAYYTLPSSFKTLSLLSRKFSVWAHWKDVHQIKEILLRRIIKEYICMVQCKPTDVEVHAGLATAFFSLARLYMDPQRSAPDEEHLWISSEYHSAEMQEKFKESAFRAIEELRILDTYAPNDLWVHSQLAQIYRDLDLIDKEIKEYETILSLAPKEEEILFRLGILYFSQGQNAQGLALYEKLKALTPTKAEQLLSYYGAGYLYEVVGSALNAVS